MVEWELGTEDEAHTPAGGYEGAGTQHAVFPGKIDGTGRGRPLAPCGAAVRAWSGVAWSSRTCELPICDECERITKNHPDPQEA